MKKLVLTSLIVATLGGYGYAQTKGAIKGAVDAGIDRLARNGAEVTYVSATLGAGGEVTLTGVTVRSDKDMVVLSSEFVKAKPVGSGGEMSVTFPEQMLLTVTPDGDEDLTYLMELRSDGLEYVGDIAKDTDGTTEGSLSADSLRLVGLTVDHPVMKNLDIEQRDIDIEVTSDEPNLALSFIGKIGAFDGEYAFDSGEQDTFGEADFKVDGIDVRFEGSGFSPDPQRDMNSFLASGGAMDLVMNFGASEGTSTSRAQGPSMRVEGNSGETSMVVSLNKNGFAYQTRFDEIDYNVTPLDGSMPVPPFTVEMSGGLIDLAMPVTASKTTDDARIGFKLSDVEVGETIWAMIDPTRTLPRTPANLELLVNADVKLNAPLGQAAAIGARNPMAAAEVQNVELESLLVEIAGADVSARGEVEIQNAGPIPLPFGSVDVVINGLNGLSTKLVDLGLVDQMQAGMAMGMLMAFAKPGTGPDQFVSKIDFQGAAIYANGRQVK